MTFNFLLFVFVYFSLPVHATPKVIICSDSTTSNYPTGPLQGWAHHISPFLTIPALNLAKAGASTRSFISMGLWKSLLAQTSPGDFVVIEMGHNDESDPSKNDKYSDRGTLPGLGNSSKFVTGSDGKKVEVYTFGHYLRQMIEDVRAVRGVVVISGMVPRNYWDKDKKSVQSNWPFADYAKEQAKASGLEFLDHTHYTVRALQDLGFEKAGKLFPQDKTHTGDEGARLNAETFICAIKCSKSSQLLPYLSEKGKAVKASC